MFRPHQPERPGASGGCGERTGLALHILLIWLDLLRQAVMWEGDRCQHHQCHMSPEIAPAESVMNTRTDTG